MPKDQVNRLRSAGSQTKIIGLIPARGGSKGIPRKNLALLAGKPLIQYTFEAALQSSTLDRVLLSTDDPEIAELAKSFGVEVPFTRPKSLATDEASGRSVQKHVLNWLESHEGHMPEVLVTLQPTSPLRRSHHIDQAVNEFWSRQVDSVIGVTPVREHPYEMVGFDGTRMYRALERPGGITPRQQYPPFYLVNGAIYVTRKEVLLHQDSSYGDHVYGYEMDPASSIDIDTPFDLQLAEYMLSISSNRGADESR